MGDGTDPERHVPLVYKPVNEEVDETKHEDLMDAVVITNDLDAAEIKKKFDEAVTRIVMKGC